eukprot:6143632-Karenia_brevis.AAC.1
MYAGKKGASATEAWYTVAMDLELTRLLNLPLVGGALDLHKCFDQIIRPLLYMILSCAGMPATVLVAYQNYHEQAWIYNSFGGNIGQAHRHACGIPQGCPLSMVFISLLLRAWIIQMRQLSVQARTLADDILLTTK